MKKEKSITPKQKQALKAIYTSIRESGFPPTLADLREKLCVSSNQSVLNFLEALERKGYIRREKDLARGMRILDAGLKILGGEELVPVVGISAAGPYLESFADAFTSWMPLSKNILQNEAVFKAKDDVFVIQISGDSMINAGINDGDKLLIKQSKEYKSGDIVVAKTDDGVTVKRFVAEGGKRYLQPENPDYERMIIIPGEVQFQGKVILNFSKIS